MSELPQDKGFQADGNQMPDHWYVQQGARLQGPYTASDIRRYLLLGRIRRNDRVSRDGDLWEPVTQVPELIPEELLDLDSEQGLQEYLEKHRNVDERVEMAADFSTDHSSHRDHPSFVAPQFQHSEIDADRRISSNDETQAAIRSEWSATEYNRCDHPSHHNPVSLLPLSLLGLTLVALLVVIYLNAVSPLL